MFEITILYLSLYILLFFAWYLSRRDVLSPSVLFAASFIMGTTFYLLGNKKNEAESIGLNTVLLIIACITIFIMVEQFVCLLIRSKKRYKCGNGYVAFHNYAGLKKEIGSAYLVGVFIVMLVTAFLQFSLESNYVGGGSFTAIVSQYRSESLMADAPHSTVVNVLSRVIYGLTPVFLFLLLFKRYICNEKFKKPLFLCTLGVFYVVLIFIIAGSRGRIFSFIFQSLTASAICINLRIEPFRKKNKGNRFWVRAVLSASIIGIPLFYYGGVIGGKNYSAITPLQSVCNYFSYGLIRLNILINHGFTKSEHFGQWSFSGVYSMLNKIGRGYDNYDIFPFYGMFGNTSTIFGRWYVDFGVVGVLVMTCAVSAFYSNVFYRMKYSCYRKEVFTLAIVYIFYISNILMASYDDWVRNILALNTLFQLMVLLVASRYMYRKYIRNDSILKQEGQSKR